MPSYEPLQTACTLPTNAGGSIACTSMSTLMLLACNMHVRNVTLQAIWRGNQCRRAFPELKKKKLHEVS